MINQIEKLKQKINEAKAANGDWNTPYQELMKAVYNSSVLFFALSRNEYNPETVESVPLISTKDFGGLPALYVFTDVNTASDWMDHYKHFTDDKEYGLIGAAEKSISSNFYSIFQIARCLGTKMIVLDEGASLVGIDIDDGFDDDGFVSVAGDDNDKIKELIDAYHKRYNKHPNLELIISANEEVMISKYSLPKTYKNNDIYLRDTFGNLYKIKENI